MTDRKSTDPDYVPIRRRDLRARGHFDAKAPATKAPVSEAPESKDAPASKSATGAAPDTGNAKPVNGPASELAPEARQAPVARQQPAAQRVPVTPEPVAQQPQPTRHEATESTERTAAREPAEPVSAEASYTSAPAATTIEATEPTVSAEPVTAEASYSTEQSTDTGLLPQPVAASDEHPDEFHDEQAVGTKRKHRKRNQAIAFGIVFVLFVAGIFFFAPRVLGMFGIGAPTDFPGPGTDVVTFSVEDGEASRNIASNLQQQGIVANVDAFLTTLDEQAGGRAIQPGDFEMRKEMSNAGAVEALLSDAARVTYIPLDAGLRVGEALQRIADGAHVDIAELEALNQNPGQFGLPERALSLEGYLWPGEYRFDEGTPATEIIQTLVDRTEEELSNLGVTDPAEQFTTLTFASIVQAEGNQTDYDRIAGALSNRLAGDNPETGGRIESDATVIYGLDRRSLNVTAEEKADTTNPFNTFATTGLPAGPIDTPGVEALQAAITPEQNDFYYWVTINLDTGETLFANTYDEHLVNVQRYQQWCSDNAGRCE